MKQMIKTIFLVLLLGCQPQEGKVNKDKLIELTNKYFSVFSEKNIDVLSSMFSEDVVLRDWENSHQGKEAVVKANKAIFDSVKTIHVTTKNMVVGELEVAAEIEVNINDSEVRLLVTDVLSFNSELKIKSVRAYKGN